jgi:N-acylglucosamine-6-phosphate 2-epimerase
MQNFDAIRGGLIVSCQAEGDDPFNRPELLALFARTAAMGGAVGIRASGCENIAAIRAAVDLPVIGITKGVFPDGSVLITEDFADVGMLIDAGAQLVALDVTQRVRPNGLTGCDFLQAVKEAVRRCRDGGRCHPGGGHCRQRGWSGFRRANACGPYPVLLTTG